jgi:type VI secretion system secreted protein Hcp
MAIYLKYAKIDGEVKTKGFEKWIECNSFQWGVGRGIGSPKGGSPSKRESSEASVSEITLTKAMDTTDPKLLLESLVGKMDNKAEIAITNTMPNGGAQDFAHYTLENTAISGYSVSSGGDRPTLSLSLNFSKVEFKYTSYDAAGTGTPETVGYNLADTTKS